MVLILTFWWKFKLSENPSFKLLHKKWQTKNGFNDAAKEKKLKLIAILVCNMYSISSKKALFVTSIKINNRRNIPHCVRNNMYDNLYFHTYLWLYTYYWEKSKFEIFVSTQRNLVDITPTRNSDWMYQITSKSNWTY